MRDDSLRNRLAGLVKARLREPGATNGNGSRPQPPLTDFERVRLAQGTKRIEAKGLRLTLDPSVQFFSPDHMRTIHRLFDGRASSEAEFVSAVTAYAAASYIYVAVRYRMRKIAEAPLQVVRQSKKDGSHEWLPNHALTRVLDDPHPDLSSNALVQRSVAYLDLTGAFLWRKVLDGGGQIARLIPFHQGEFSVESSSNRMHARFGVETATGREWLTPEEVVYHQEPDPFDWTRGVSKVDVALGWLNLGQQARATVQDILRNGLFPSVITQADPDWNPDEEEWELFKEQLAEYANREKRGGPLALLGGGTATRVSLTLRELIPTDIMDRVESVIASTFGIPAVVLQYEIGLKNAPWSQMEEARRMAYEDSIEPTWRELEATITRQLLWAPPAANRSPVEANRSILVTFDASRIRALQKDLAALSTVVAQWGDIASLNEKRNLLGLEPHEDPAADEIPALTKLKNPPPALPNPFGAPPPADESEEEASRRLDWQRKLAAGGGAAAPLPFPRRPPTR